MKRKRLLLVTLICGLLITLFPLAAIAAPTPSPPSQEGPECNPRAAFLSTWIGVDCSVLMQYQLNGIGFGVIMKAYFLSQIPGFGDWETLLNLHQGDIGWGQIIKAYTLASLLGLNAEDLLTQHAGGKGWGDILKEHDLGPGKPPWAGQGPPPWAHRGKPPWAGPHRPTE